MTDQEKEILTMILRLRDLGCAVSVILGSELVGIDADRVEQAMLRSGYDEIWHRCNAPIQLSLLNSNE